MRLIFLKTSDGEPENRVHVGDGQAVELMAKDEPPCWKQLNIGGERGVRCQHMQVLVTNLLQRQWEGQVRPTHHISFFFSSRNNFHSFFLLSGNFGGELLTCTFMGPGAAKHHQKKTSKRGEKERKVWEEGLPEKIA